MFDFARIADALFLFVEIRSLLETFGSKRSFLKLIVHFNDEIQRGSSEYLLLNKELYFHKKISIRNSFTVHHYWGTQTFKIKIISPNDIVPDCFYFR